MFKVYLDYLKSREGNGLLRTLKPPQNKSFLDFSSNDALGLSTHPALQDAVLTDTPSIPGSGGSRLLCQKQDLFFEVEQKIANLKGTQTALLFGSGFQANISVIAALLDQKIHKISPLVFTDKYIHASMHQGCQLAGVKQIRFRHQDILHLKARLEAYRHSTNPKFILLESLYGMEGSITDMAAVTTLAKEHQAFLYVDEAHATGIYGDKGAGFTKAFAHDIPCVLGTFSKALGSFGGFIACSDDLKAYLLNRAQGLIYSTALPPMLLKYHNVALDLLPQLEAERKKLKALPAYAKQQFSKLPFKVTNSQSHIFGILIENIEQARKIQSHLAHQDILVSLIRPPTVPTHATRLRVSLSVKHTEEDIDRLVHALIGSHLS